MVDKVELDLGQGCIVWSVTQQKMGRFVHFTMQLFSFSQ
jgi:hypothetical protein